MKRGRRIGIESMLYSWCSIYGVGGNQHVVGWLWGLWHTHPNKDQNVALRLWCLISTTIMHQFWIQIFNPVSCSRHAMKNHFWPLILRRVLLSTVHHHVLSKSNGCNPPDSLLLFSRSSRALEPGSRSALRDSSTTLLIIFYSQNDCRPRPRSSTRYTQFILPAYGTKRTHSLTLLCFRPSVACISTLTSD
jgi:hypothetical protein